MLTTIAGGMIARTLLPLFEGVVYPPDRNVERTKEMDSTDDHVFSLGLLQRERAESELVSSESLLVRLGPSSTQ